MPSRMTDLPAEIRELIFAYALCSNVYYLPAMQLPALTRVSKQIREESLPLVFSKGHFIVSLSTDFKPIHGNVTDTPAEVPNSDSQVSIDDLGLSERTSSMLLTAGKAARIQHIDLKLTHAPTKLLDRAKLVAAWSGTKSRRVWPRTYKRQLRQYLALEEVVNLHLRWVNHSLITNKTPGTCHPDGWWSQIMTPSYTATDVDDTIHTATALAKAQAKIEDFQGFSIDDLRAIATALTGNRR